jgi:hypothetical protein
VADTKPKSPALRLYLFAAVLIFVPIAASRGTALVSSFVSTDIRYMETALPAVLDYLRLTLSVFAFGAAAASAVTAVFRCGKKSGAAVIGIHAAVLLLDAVTAVLIDTLSGAVSGGMILLAVFSCLADALWNVLLSFLGWYAACRAAAKQRTEEGALLSASLIHMGGRLLLETVYLIQFLIEVEFLPYAREIVVIVGEYLRIVCFYGGVTFIGAWLIFTWLNRTFLRKE